MEFDVAYIGHQWPMLMKGLGMSVLVTLISLLVSMVIGAFGAVWRTLRTPVLARACRWYVEGIRNTPILAQLFFIYYGLPAIGLSLSSFWSGVVCLSLWAGAYQIENFRGGLLMIPKGIKDASDALGLNRAQYFRHVAFPVALRSCLPAVLNTAISMLKNSSYLQTIGLVELTYVAVDRIATDFKAFEMFSSIAVLYMCLVAVMSLAGRHLEARMRHAGGRA